jgi:hypothetical protein
MEKFATSHTGIDREVHGKRLILGLREFVKMKGFIEAGIARGPSVQDDFVPFNGRWDRVGKFSC